MSVILKQDTRAGIRLVRQPGGFAVVEILSDGRTGQVKFTRNLGVALSAYRRATGDRNAKINIKS